MHARAKTLGRVTMEDALHMAREGLTTDTVPEMAQILTAVSVVNAHTRSAIKA